MANLTSVIAKLQRISKGNYGLFTRFTKDEAELLLSGLCPEITEEKKGLTISILVNEDDDY